LKRGPGFLNSVTIEELLETKKRKKKENLDSSKQLISFLDPHNHVACFGALFSGMHCRLQFATGKKTRKKRRKKGSLALNSLPL
jgi:hypothetical protein